MKIIISGGWGYGNLGDDAILIALIKILYELYPDAELTVLSYNKKETQDILNDYPIKVYSSIHKTLMGNTVNRKLKILNRNNTIAKKRKNLINRIINYIVRHEIMYKEKFSFKLFNLFKSNLSLLPNHKLLKDCDLFILGGGEYLNVWDDSVYAHTLELYLAKKYGVKSLILCQSIGPFGTELTKTIIFNALRGCEKIVVRDTKSYLELKSGKLDSSIVPDLALTEKYSMNESNFISVIISRELSDNSISDLAKVLNIIQNKCNINIKVLISRRWIIDLKLAHELYSKLDAKKNFLIIPNTLDKLNMEIQNSKLIISSNLHGLILGWRASVPCICINNRRKFISFMEQTKQEDRIFSPKNFEILSLIHTIEQVLSNNELRSDLNEFAEAFISSHKDQVKEIIQSIMQ